MILKGYRDRTERERRERRMERAWEMCWILLPHTPSEGEPITPDQVLSERSAKLIFPALKKRKAKAAGPTITEEQARARGAELFKVHQQVFAGKV